MHMADALLSPGVAVTMYAASSAAAAVSVHKFRQEETLIRDSQIEYRREKLPTMAVMAALVFAGQMINFTIPGTGSSGHICGSILLTALLGPYAAFLSMIAVLLIQALFFADGGLMALGANIWNMSFYGCFLGYFVIYRPIMRSRLFAGRGDAAAKRARITLASILACVVSLQFGAFSVVLETSLSGITDLPFGAFVLVMQPIHLAIGAVEGMITAAVLLFINESRPELLQDNYETGNSGTAKAKMSFTALILTLIVSVAVTGGGLSLLASSNPDGLEWSLFGNTESGYSSNMGLDEENYGVDSSAADKAGKLQERTSLLPDYSFSGDSENPVGTVVSGLLGSAMVAVLAILIWLFSLPGRRRNQASSHTKASASANSYKAGKAEIAANELREMDDLVAINSPVRNLGAGSKLLMTLCYIAVVVSFNKYDFAGLLVMLLLPLAGYALSGIKLSSCFRKLRIVMPLVCAVGIFNPFFDKAALVTIGNFEISGGVVSMLTLMLKGIFCLMASFLLVATTRIEEICSALRLIHIPKLMTSLLLLTYRYISVFVDEIAIMSQSYHLRAPNQKGINISAWGSFLGQLILRSSDKADALYESMKLRGFDGEFDYATARGKTGSVATAVIVCVMIIALRFYNIPALISGLFI
ncbi:MAG: PDGLE domain-containing protein [Mogibacterium sp.]|nr:PDGLE domain-containing protein [Mogibacterium sp.]